MSSCDVCGRYKQEGEGQFHTEEAHEDHRRRLMLRLGVLLTAELAQRAGHRMHVWGYAGPVYLLSCTSPDCTFKAVESTSMVVTRIRKRGHLLSIGQEILASEGGCRACGHEEVHHTPGGACRMCWAEQSEKEPHAYEPR